MKPKELKIFNLERALAGDPVVTGNGIEVKNLVGLLNVVKDTHCCMGWVGIKVMFWNVDGKVNCNYDDKYNDLFMAPIKKKLYANLYRDPYRLSNVYVDRDACVRDSNFDRYIETIEFEIEE